MRGERHDVAKSRNLLMHKKRLRAAIKAGRTVARNAFHVARAVL